mgnify:CR=1 FL=1|tara:strand:- start:526 stop:1791 length:1266 start_codon:yes stop_codon:yes gene_type:complete
MILDFNIVYSLLRKFERAGQEETPSTPVWLVREMLDKLPPEIWSDPSKTFLDPACSTGTFLLEIVRKLNTGLASQMPDQTERLKHILAKQIWGSGLSRVPFFVTIAAFEKLFIDTTGIVGKVNIYHADELDGVEEIKDMKFDVVVGNPPYQAPAKTHKGHKNPLNGNTLWDKFVSKAIKELTTPNGIVSMIHPAGWRKPQSEKARYKGMMQFMAHENHMTYLSIHSAKDGKKTFNASTRYDWYVIQKGSTGMTTVNDEKGEESLLDFRDWKWIPNHSFDAMRMLLGDGEVIYSRSSYGSDRKYTSKEKSEGEFIHPIIHSITKKGVRYMYSNRNDRGHFGIPKVILSSAAGTNDVIIDDKGEYGMTDMCLAIPIENRKDGEELKKYLMSDKMTLLLEACLFANYRLDWRVFRDFKKGFWRN